MNRDKIRKLDLKKLGRLYTVQLDSCTRCGVCIPLCPVYNEVKDPKFSPAFRIQLLKNLAKGKVDIEKHGSDVSNIFFQCSVCGVCEQVCGSLITTPAIWELAREQSIKMGLGTSKHKTFMERVEQVHNPYGADPDKRLEWLPQSISVEKECELGWYVGCTQSYREQRYAVAVAELLRHLGIKFTLLGNDEWCCCSPLMRTGWTETVPQVVKHTVQEFKKRKVRRVLYTCAGCYRTSLIDWPMHYGANMPFNVIHITAFLYELMLKGLIKPERPYGKVVTWHDPCHIGRHSGIFTEPRKILQSIPKVEYVELERAGELSKCCGAGGGVKGGYPDLALKIAYQRLKDAEVAGVDVLVTSCPFCLRNFKDAAKAFGSKLEIKDLAELLADLLGLSIPSEK